MTYDSTTIVLSVLEYGESVGSAVDYNLRGRVRKTFDGAGKNKVYAYDFKGMPLLTEMQLLEDGTLADADWSATPTLSAEVFTTSAVVDALGRMVTQTDAGNNVTRNTYDKGGALNGVYLTPDGGSEDTYVSEIRYDAKGQRLAIWYGNNTKTSYEYDEENYRLRRMFMVNLGPNEMMLDLNCYYDPVGNITTLRDEAQETVFYDNTAIEAKQEYTYDALYRLIRAKGREQIAIATFDAADDTNDALMMSPGSAPFDGNALRNYTQHYKYDRVGNITELKHCAGTGSYTRAYTYTTGTNRLESTGKANDDDSMSYDYTHDARGNMITMPHLSAMNYDAMNQMKHTTAGSIESYYQYSGGQRVRKYVDKGSGLIEERIYLGSFEIFRKWDSSTLDLERTTVHIMDDTGRIAMLEVRISGKDGDTEDLLRRFIYSNHLQSAALELDHDARIISYEEYHPYGTTAYQATNGDIHAVAKRYRYTGKERDEETGLNYHGARYYAPWLGRWCAVDPLESKYAPHSSYNYSFNNPIVWNDITGASPGDDDKPGKQPILVKAIDEGGKEVPAGTTLIYDGLSKGKVDANVDIFSGSPTITTGKLNNGKIIAPAGYIYSITYVWQKYDGQKDGHYELLSQGFELLEASKPPETQTSPVIPDEPVVINPPRLTIPPPKPGHPKPTPPKPTPPKPAPPKPIQPPTKQIPPFIFGPHPPITIPPPAPNPDDLCFTCFIGESDMHWKNGVNALASWLINNPNYNLIIRADGGTRHVPFSDPDTWNDHPTLNRHGDETIYERLFRQFTKLAYDVIKASGGKITLDRLLLMKGTPEGRSLQYQVRKR